MNVLEKAEKALEFLKNNEQTAKSHELQAAAGTLGRCLGALGSRPSYARHYANLLHTAIPTLLFLASNDSAEVRLVGDEALNRAVVGGFAFHSHKTNIILQNQIDCNRKARWIRAILSRICLGECWLRPGVGKIRSQAQTLFPKLSQIVRQTTGIQLIVEALEANLPRILNALAEYTTDEEITDLSKALLNHVETTEPALRRGISTCVAHLCSHRETLINTILASVFDKLWPITTDNTTILGWFCVIKALFQINDMSKLGNSGVLTLQDYLELYHLILNYIEVSTDHNTQNTVLECMSVLLSTATLKYKRPLVSKHPISVNLNERGSRKISNPPTVTPSRFAPSPSEPHDLELSFSGALQLGSILQLSTPSLSCEDLSSIHDIQTPDSPASETDINIKLPDTEQLTKDLAEKLELYEEEHKDDICLTSASVKINIGTIFDDDVPLKYCARLLASKYLLTGNKGGVISDRAVRVSVKSSALSCLSEILRIYPQAITMYLDKDEDIKNHNVSGSSEGTESQDNTNDFVLERNVCYQDSLSESLSQDMLKSIDSQTPSQKQKLEKSSESDLKSSKDIQSGILDSRIYAKSDLIASALSQDTNIMTNSNFTSNSGMTGSNDPTTGYPMTSSGDILSSSIDLDMKFDHFGESTTNLDNLKDLQKKVEKAIESSNEENVKVYVDESTNTEVKEEFVCQHMSDVFVLLSGHSDPQIRGIIRVCIGNYLVASLEQSHGDYDRWKGLNMLAKEVTDVISAGNLIDIVLKGLSDDIHSTVTHTLTALATLTPALCNNAHWPLLVNVLNALVNVENNGYWLCKVNLCRFYEKVPFWKLFMLYPDYHRRSKHIMDTLIRLLADQDQKVRNAASHTIAVIIPKIYPSKTDTPTKMVTKLALEQAEVLKMEQNIPTLNLVRDIYFYSDVPDQLKNKGVYGGENLRVVIGDIMARIMASNCKNFTQGLLETLQCITEHYSPWNNIQAYSDQGILSYCLDSLDCCNGTVASRSVMLDLCRMIYPVEIHNIMRYKTNRDIFERDTPNKWQHLSNDSIASSAEKFLQVTLKMLNVLVHLIEEVNPNVHLNKGGIALPGSPVRRKTQEPLQRKGSTATESSDEKLLRKKPSSPATSLKANFAGHFFNEPFYMKFYESLRAAYSNYKINLEPKTSVFYTFLKTVLNCLTVQLELATDKELGTLTEEILYYLKVIMPFCAELSVHCVTQLLKCLFGTNMLNQYADYLTITDKITEKTQFSFFEDVMKLKDNNNIKIENESRRSSLSSNASQRLFMDGRNPKMVLERQLLIAMENFAKNKSDKKWSTNKKELERYIRLFEPVVIQSLKSYTMQNDIPLQCQVLKLLNQLLTLRVNYCMLDSDQIFIGFLLKQLDLVEQHEIPNCCDLVNSILMFLVQLSSSKHHTKQLIEIPKLIQLCDGLMASGAHAECIAGLEPVAVKVFSNMGGTSVLGRAQQQEAQATREVLFYMLQKTMHQEKVLNLVSCVLCLSQEQPESYYRWSELAIDTVQSLLAARSMELESVGCAGALERLLQCICEDTLTDQPRLEALLNILFQAPPHHTAPSNLKLRYLTSVMVLLRKYLHLIPESEILLTIDYMKATCISPHSIFFNVKTDVDPLNVQNVNENCANLSPDVVLVRFLFKTLTYAIMELEGCYEDANLDLNNKSDRAQSSRLMYAVCVNIIVYVKNMLHLTDGCHFPLTSKTAQNLLHNEQSGLNTGLYSPTENIPLDKLNAICLKAAYKLPLLTVHWSHLLIRLNFLSHKYWQKLLGYARNFPFSADSDARTATLDVLQTACVMAYCEYFVENGITEAVHLSWLLVNRIHLLILHHGEAVVQRLLGVLHDRAGAAGLLLQAVAARCQPCLKNEFALNTFKILSDCHESQSGPLVFLICRIIGKLEPAIAVRFAKLAVDRCKLLKELPLDKINAQLTKEDVQVALELLQRDKVHIRYSSLVMELNSLAASVFDLSPLDLSQDRAINPQHIVTTNVDSGWLLNQVKTRCCVSECTSPKVTKHNELARLLSNLSRDELTAVMTCPEFDRKLLSACFKVSTENYLREFVNVVCAHDAKETERDNLKGQKERRDEMTSSIDSNKLNVVNTLHVFKKSDNKESKSQFFIPINDNDNIERKLGNLQISDEETELILPELSNLYLLSAVTFDKSLTDVIRLFPKQNRPLSQSENFNLNIEQTIDRYTRRCHQVFQDKQFYQEFMTIQTIMTGFLESISQLIIAIDDVDCELLEKCIENILPLSLAKNIAIFSVISLQYMSFLIKNKSIVESPVPADVSFRVSVNVTDNVTVDNVIQLTVANVAKALSFEEIWLELNLDSNLNRAQSAISCLYAIVKYLVKDTKPLNLKHYMQHEGPKPEMMYIGDKLITLIEYWEQNFYRATRSDVIPQCFIKSIESLIVSLSRLEMLSNTALIPPIAWPSVDVVSKNNGLLKIELPLQALQDMDVLDPFLFRVNLIGWVSKKQFEEMWVATLGGLQGNAADTAIRAVTHLLLSTAPKDRRGMRHMPRHMHADIQPMPLLRNILIGTSAYHLFDEINLERVPLLNDGFDGFHTAQLNTEYLKLASDIIDDASFKIKRELKRRKQMKDIDVNSCLQILMDVTSQMLEPKAGTGISSRVALVQSVGCLGGVYGGCGQWWWAGEALLSAVNAAPCPAAPRALLVALPQALAVLHSQQQHLQELSSVHQKLVKSLASNHAPLRQAALQGCLLQLNNTPDLQSQSTPNPYQELVAQLNMAVRQYLNNNTKISVYEQSLYWTVLFTLIELGHPDLINMAADFILNHPTHYCAELVVKGIITKLRQQVLPKDLKNILIEKIVDNIKMYNENHAVQILMVHLFLADNKLLSPRLTSDVSNMDPDILMSSMERLTLLYKLLRHCQQWENQKILATAMKYFLRETLPPAATLSRVVIEFLECCKKAEKLRMGVLSERAKWVDRAVLNSEIVFEVFETSLSQDQLPVLSGWVFEALCHLLHGKISQNLVPYTVLTLLTSASANDNIRRITPLCSYILRLGFHKCGRYNLGMYTDFLDSSVRMSFNDRRLLCIVSLKSLFTGSQLEKLKELCDSNDCLSDLTQCLAVLD